MSIFHVENNERVAVFIDGAHSFECAKALNIQIDYPRMKKTLQDEANLRQIFVYWSLPAGHDDNDNRMKPLMDKLEYSGFMLTSVSGKGSQRGCAFMALALDAIAFAPNVDRVILFAADSDLSRLAHDLRRKHDVRVTLLSIDALVSDELRKQADHFIDLKAIKEAVERRNEPSAPKQ